MDKGYYQITNDFITDIVRVQTAGSVPFNNSLWDIVLHIIGFVSSDGKLSPIPEKMR